MARTGAARRVEGLHGNAHQQQDAGDRAEDDFREHGSKQFVHGFGHHVGVIGSQVRTSTDWRFKGEGWCASAVMIGCCIMVRGSFIDRRTPEG